MWASGERNGSIMFMRQFADSLTRDLQGRPERASSSAVSKSRMDELSKLLARCYLKLGEWQFETGEDWSIVTRFIHKQKLI
jgi:FKBP12-rapamycin complex-associated protein